MEDRRERNGPFLSVPQFGDWDQKGGALPDYSMDFSKIREMRKQNKTRASLGNEEDFINPTATMNTNTTNTNNTKTNTKTAHSSDDHNHHYQQRHHHAPPTPRRSFLRYFNCCVKT